MNEAKLYTALAFYINDLEAPGRYATWMVAHCAACTPEEAKAKFKAYFEDDDEVAAIYMAMSDQGVLYGESQRQGIMRKSEYENWVKHYIDDVHYTKVR